jgi:hypothetical protein
MNVEGGMRNEQSIGQRAWGKVEVGRRNAEFGSRKVESGTAIDNVFEQRFELYCLPTFFGPCLIVVSGQPTRLLVIATIPFHPLT